MAKVLVVTSGKGGVGKTTSTAALGAALARDGQNVVVGKTVTLELKPEQAETLARARQTGTLALALRSIADANATDARPDDQSSRRGDTINVVRYGVPSSTTTLK